MKIQVTQKHIDNSRQILMDTNMSVCLYCPIALAIKDVILDVHVSVGPSNASIEYSPVSFSKDVSDFICNFDSGRKVYPFEFELNYEK